MNIEWNTKKKKSKLHPRKKRDKNSHDHDLIVGSAFNGVALK